MQSALLDQSLWDLVIGTDGDLAIASDPYSISQDVCCAIRTFQGEVWFDTDLGVPYFQQILGKFPSAQFLKAQFVKAALTVPQVTAARCFLSSITNRSISGQVQFTFLVDGVVDGSTLNGIINFVGDDQQFVTFVGDNNAFVGFVGS